MSLEKELSVDRLDSESVEKELSKGVPLPSVSHGNSRMVGHGTRTNQYCGQYMKLRGCPRVENHHNTLEGNFEGKIYRKIIHHDCGKPSCPICYPIWAKRAARKIERRLSEAAKRHAIPVEHLVISFPASMYDLGIDVLRGKVEKALFARGIFGGSLISHAFRFGSVSRKWFLSIHWHSLALLQGYRRCRGCSHNPELLKALYREGKTTFVKDDACERCEGFEGLTRRCNKEDGIIVKVADALHERWNLADTAEYELGHASYDATKKRSNVVTWFGLCSYRKLKAKPEVKVKAVCPLCHEELVDMLYTGKKRIVTDRRDENYVSESWEEAYEDGVRVYEEIIRSGRYGAGGYEGDMDAFNWRVSDARARGRV